MLCLSNKKQLIFLPLKDLRKFRKRRIVRTVNLKKILNLIVEVHDSKPKWLKKSRKFNGIKAKCLTVVLLEVKDQ
jgi:hypothetical protein